MLWLLLLLPSAGLQASGGLGVAEEGCGLGTQGAWPRLTGRAQGMCLRNKIRKLFNDVFKKVLVKVPQKHAPATFKAPLPKINSNVVRANNHTPRVKRNKSSKFSKKSQPYLRLPHSARLARRHSEQEDHRQPFCCYLVMQF